MPVHLVHQAPTDRLAHPAKTERKDHPAHQLLLSHPHLVMQAVLAKTAHQDQLVKTEHQDPTVDPAQQVPKARPAQPDHQATTALQETKDRPAPMDPRESLVYARNIAPPTAVSSSRMEQGDKRRHPRPRSPMDMSIRGFSSSDHGIRYLPRLEKNYYYSPSFIIIILASMSFAPSFNIAPHSSAAISFMLGYFTQ